MARTARESMARLMESPALMGVIMRYGRPKGFLSGLCSLPR